MLAIPFIRLRPVTVTRTKRQISRTERYTRAVKAMHRVKVDGEDVEIVASELGMTRQGLEKRFREIDRLNRTGHTDADRPDDEPASP